MQGAVLRVRDIAVAGSLSPEERALLYGLYRQAASGDSVDEEQP
jgi:hypothetical protein